MAKRKRQSDMFGGMKSYALSLGGLGITGAVAAQGAAQAPAGTPNLMQGYSTMASFTPIMGTMVGAAPVLKQLKKMNKGKRY